MFTVRHIVDTFEGGKASYRNFGGKIKTQVKILSFFYKHMKKSCLRKYHKLEYAGKILQMQLGQNLFCKIFKKLHVHCSGQKVALLCLRYVDTWPNLLTLEFNWRSIIFGLWNSNIFMFLFIFYKSLALFSEYWCH